MKNALLYYSVGALLYCPAVHKGIVSSLRQEKIGNKFSLALCLEDTISDNYVEKAEEQLVLTIKQLYYALQNKSFFVPKIFIRIRKKDQIEKLLEQFGESKILITGFIIPKLSVKNMDLYVDIFSRINKYSNRGIYMMPILETPDLIDLRNRYELLYKIKEHLKPMGEYILNIRVGGNDLCNLFGFRRSYDESIYNIGVIASFLSDIITVFGGDYIISGPVWEYYNGKGWDIGLIKELKKDRLCGFVGKTVIHPKQIELVNAAYRVSKKDLEDAKLILSWDKNSPLYVSGSFASERMNEYKVHYNWAEKIIMLSKVYGTK